MPSVDKGQFSFTNWYSNMNVWSVHMGKHMCKSFLYFHEYQVQYGINGATTKQTCKLDLFLLFEKCVYV